MRKDTQLGLAIGGVTLAVLIVWGLVITGSHKTAKQVANLETTGKTQQPADTDREIPPPVAHNDDHATETAPPIGSTPDRGTTDSGASGGTSESPAPTETPKTPSDKKETNWQALLMADGIESVPAALHSTTPVVTPPGTEARSSHGPGASEGGSSMGSTMPPSGTSTDAGSQAHPRTHTVQRGESFYTISKAIYGDGKYAAQIAKANPSIDPKKLRIGTQISLPDVAQIKSEVKSDTSAAAPRTHRAAAAPTALRASAEAPAVDGKSQYRVEAGDNLYKISKRLYGSGEEVEHIYELNKSAIGPDKSKLKLGMILKLPAAPTATASR